MCIILKPTCFWNISALDSLICSHLQKTKGGWEGWSDVLLHDSQWNGMWYQKWTFFGARRVWWESIWDEDQLHPWGDGNGKNLHLGCEPTGRGNTSARLLIILSFQFSSFHCSVMLFPPKGSQGTADIGVPALRCVHRSSGLWGSQSYE